MSTNVRCLSQGERAILQQDGPEDEDGPRILESRTSVARRHHTCDTCGIGGIAPGESYRRLVILGDDGFQIQRFCTRSDPPQEAGSWHCESQRLQAIEHERSAWVSELTRDGTITVAAAEQAFETHRAEKAERAERERLAEQARRASRPPVTGADDDLPF